MDEYDKEMFIYLTQPQNYKAAKTISQILSNDVEPRLDTEFWKLVNEQLYLLLKDSINKELNLVIDESVENIKKTDWKGVSISRDTNDIGIKIDLSLIDRSRVMELLYQKDPQKHLGDKETQPWPRYFHNCLTGVGDYFSKLPTTRETKISEYANIIFNYIEKATNICDEINILRK